MARAQEWSNHVFPPSLLHSALTQESLLSRPPERKSKVSSQRGENEKSAPIFLHPHTDTDLLLITEEPSQWRIHTYSADSVCVLGLSYIESRAVSHGNGRHYPISNIFSHVEGGGKSDSDTWTPTQLAFDTYHNF